MKHSYISTFNIGLRMGQLYTSLALAQAAITIAYDRRDLLPRKISHDELLILKNQLSRLEQEVWIEHAKKTHNEQEPIYINEIFI